MRSVGVKGTPNVRRRPITRGALGALVGSGGAEARRTVGGRIPGAGGEGRRNGEGAGRGGEGKHDGAGRPGGV